MLRILAVMADEVAATVLGDGHRRRLAALGSLDGPRSDLGGIERADVLLTGWGCPPVDAAALERAPTLRAIVHAAGSVKGHVTEACWERGLLVSSAAAANAVPVAEFTVAAIVMVNKGAFRLARAYAARRTRVVRTLEPSVRGNYRRRVGIVGASHVGRSVIGRLRAYDLEVVVHDPFLTPGDAATLGVQALGLEELLATSDVVSLHAPALPSTRHLLDARRLALLRDGAALVNTARGSLVDTEALTRELATGRIDAVLDVTDPEPLPEDSPLYEMANVFLTPHLAGSIGDETHRMTEVAIEEIERLARGEPLAHPVVRSDLERIA